MPIVPESFTAPEVYTADGFRLELLGPRHNAADHAAWISSVEHIQATPGFGDGWPPEAGMTLEENLADLVSHQDRSARGVDFAYTVMDERTGAIIGCVYFKPSRTPGGPVRALSWVTAERADLDEPLTRTVAAWLRAAWPFPVVDYRIGPDEDRITG